MDTCSPSVSVTLKAPVAAVSVSKLMIRDAARRADRLWLRQGVHRRKADRPQLAAALAYLRPGDILVVWPLDRRGRNMQHLIDTVNTLAGRDVQFRSLRESIDTSSAAGRLVFHVFAALAEFERDLLKERAAAGLAAITANRARGRAGGKPRKMTPEKTAVTRQMYESQQYTVEQIAHTLGVTRRTVYQHLNP